LSNNTVSANTITYSWFQSWLVSFFKPSMLTFQKLAADPRAGMRRAFAWAFLGSLGTSIAAAAVLLVTGSIAGLELLKNPDALPGGWGIPLLAALLVPLAATGGIISLLADSLVTHLAARILGGRGRYRKLVYCKSTYLVPAALVSMGISFIPGLGAAAVLVELYCTILDMFAVKVVYSFSWGRAAAVAIVPFILSLLIKSLLVLLVIVIIIGVGR
jgi:hypothetical protein